MIPVALLLLLPPPLLLLSPLPLLLVEEEAAKRATNKSWLESVWVNARAAGPEKALEESAESTEMRRMRKALARGRRGGLAVETAERENPQSIAQTKLGMSPIAERRQEEAIVMSPESSSFRQRQAATESLAKPVMVTMAEALEQIRARLNLGGLALAGVQLSPEETLRKARERLALPAVEITDKNLEAECSLICAGMGIALEDDEARERKKVQVYMTQRGRRTASTVTRDALIDRVADVSKYWRASNRSKQETKVWFCEQSGCGHKNAPLRWRCAMCGARNMHLATSATSAIYETKECVAQKCATAEHRVLHNMAGMVSQVKERAEQRRREAAAKAQMEARAAEEAREQSAQAQAAEKAMAIAHARRQQEALAAARARTAEAVQVRQRARLVSYRSQTSLRDALSLRTRAFRLWRL